jgi:hypothetical protein
MKKFLTIQKKYCNISIKIYNNNYNNNYNNINNNINT